MMLVIPVLAVLIMTAASRLHHAEMTATAGILLINWTLNSLFVWATGDATPWLLFMIADYLSGMALFVVLASRWQVCAIALFAAMEVIHAGFGVSSQDDYAKYVYWWALFYAALTQVAVAGGWVVSESLRRRLGPARRAQPALATVEDQGSKA